MQAQYPAIVSTEDLRLALLDAFGEPMSTAQHIVDLTDIARAASSLSAEDVKATLIRAAQQRRYSVRKAAA